MFPEPPLHQAAQPRRGREDDGLDRDLQSQVGSGECELGPNRDGGICCRRFAAGCDRLVVVVDVLTLGISSSVRSGNGPLGKQCLLGETGRYSGE